LKIRKFFFKNPQTFFLLCFKSKQKEHVQMVVEDVENIENVETEQSFFFKNADYFDNLF